MRLNFLKHEFVKVIPPDIEAGIIYISKEYEVAIHACCCGCGEEVVTPLGPVDWELTDHGTSISLHPSIGNWSFKCQSHYWITKGKVIWSYQMSPSKIKQIREHNAKKKRQYYANKAGKKKSLWRRIWEWLFG